MAFDNGSKPTCAGTSTSTISQANAALDTLIDALVKRVEGLRSDTIFPEEPSIQPFVIFLIYKAAVITTGRLQNGIQPGSNMQRLRVLRNALIVIAQRWLAGGENPHRFFLIDA